MKNKVKALASEFKKEVLGKKVVGKAVALAMAVSATMVAACAAEGDVTSSVDMTAITSAFSSGINTLITTSIQLISIMLPLVLSFFAVKFVSMKGMTWLKQMASK